MTRGTVKSSKTSRRKTFKGMPDLSANNRRKFGSTFQTTAPHSAFSFSLLLQSKNNFGAFQSIICMIKNNRILFCKNTSSRSKNLTELLLGSRVYLFAPKDPKVIKEDLQIGTALPRVYGAVYQQLGFVFHVSTLSKGNAIYQSFPLYSYTFLGRATLTIL